MKLYLSLLLLIALLAGQDRQNEFKLARIKGLAAAGKKAEALQEMKELYRTDPNDRRFVDQYVILLKDQDQLAEVIKVYEYQLLRRPGDLNYTLELAGAYFESGAKEQALKIWDSASKQLANQVHHFSQIANSLLQHRLYEEAIDVYQQAQQQSKQPTMFLVNIAQLQQYVFKFSDALDSYLELLRLQPAQYSLVSNRIFQLYDQPEAIAAIDSFTVKLNINRPAEARLKTDLLIKSEHFNEALELLKSPRFRSGNELYNFADQMRRIGQFKLSEKAFSYLIDGDFEDHHIDNARIGQINLKIDQFNAYRNDHLKDSIATLVDKMATSILDKEQLTDLRLIYADHLLRDRIEPDKSYMILHPVISNDRLRALNPYASIILADIYFMKREFDKSKFVLDNLTHRNFEGQKFFKLAGIALMNGKSDQLRDMLSKLIQSREGLKNLYVNDLIQLFMEASALANDNSLIKNYSDIFYYYQTNQYKQALTAIDVLSEKSTSFRLNGDRLKFNLFLKLDRLEDCLQIAQSYFKSKTQDEWQLKEAKILIKQNKRNEAKQILTQLILDFPSGFWSNEARKILQDIS
ncbi:MAG: hypothetical protein KDD94_09685 [Calditrichaeota bacterium]|nr:hypothetical protein [Calditrichota bacterium]